MNAYGELYIDTTGSTLNAPINLQDLKYTTSAMYNTGIVKLKSFFSEETPPPKKKPTKYNNPNSLHITHYPWRSAFEYTSFVISIRNRQNIWRQTLKVITIQRGRPWKLWIKNRFRMGFPIHLNVLFLHLI